MKYSVIILALLLAGCASKPVPVIQKFPVAPDQLQEPCQSLKPLEINPKLSDVAKTVAENYTLYHECAIRVQAWTQWYRSQKRIFEEPK